MFEKIGVAWTSIVIGFGIGYIASDAIRLRQDKKKLEKQIEEKVDELYNYLLDLQEEHS